MQVLLSQLSGGDYKLNPDNTKADDELIDYFLRTLTRDRKPSKILDRLEHRERKHDFCGLPISGLR